MWETRRSSIGSTCGLAFQVLLALSDEDLFTHIQHEDGDAVAILFQRHRRLSHRIALQILRDAGEAEDAVQEVFIDLYRARHTYDPARGTVKVWLMQFVYHRCFRRKRQLESRKFYSQTDVAEVQLSSENEHTNLESAIEQKQALHGALALAEGPHRRVLELVAYEGLTLREIASQTGETLENVRHHYYRGLKKIKSRLGVALSTSEGGRPEGENDR